MSDTLRAVRHAIVHKQPVSAIYHGRHRILCPHVVGTKDGTWNVLSYQSGGESSSGLSANPAANWRCMRVSDLSSVEAAPHHEWQTGPNHTRPQTCVDHVDAEVSY